jgi:hypothetical protein
MTLKFNTPFGQRDVRETPAPTASATATVTGAPPDAEYLTLDTNANLTAERVLTSGSGINIADGGAGAAATISNTGVTSCAAGEGIDVSGSTGAVTISGEDSSSTNKGIVIVSPGEGIDVSYSSGTATVSGENASTSNKGIARFNSSDFTVSSGAVSLKSKTSYLSMENVAGSALCPIVLPHGVTITGITGYGSSGNWAFYRRTLSDNSTDVMASGAYGSEDTSISYATVDNSQYSYVCELSDNTPYGVSVKYTTDYD